MRPALLVLFLCSLGGASPAWPQDDAVVVTAVRDPVDKSYRRMVRGMETFEKRKAQLAPGASLRFRLLPRRAGLKLEETGLELVGESFARWIEVAPDHTFTMPRDRAALEENASVLANRRALTVTWRADVRTPGLPGGTRRLGDLRLECAVGMEAGLISNVRSPLGRLAAYLFESADYCNRPNNRYLFFAERPLFNVTLVAGARREDVPVARLYGGASVDPGWKDDLAYCDCEVLIDRAYFLPLGDASWPDDTQVRFQYMDEAREAAAVSKPQVAAAFGKPVAIDFPSGYEVWVYAGHGDFAVLFGPDGLARKARYQASRR